MLEGLWKRVSRQGPGRRHRQGDAGGAPSLPLRRGDGAAVWFVFDGPLRGVGFAAPPASSPIFSLVLSALSIPARRPPRPVPASSLNPRGLLFVDQASDGAALRPADGSVW